MSEEEEVAEDVDAMEEVQAEEVQDEAEALPRIGKRLMLFSPSLRTPKKNTKDLILPSSRYNDC